MITFTLDTNCLIDLEEKRAAAAYVRRLADAHLRGMADVAVATVTASERQKGSGFLENYSEFKRRLASLDLAGLSQIMPIAHWDVSFYGHGLWANEEMVLREQAIHVVLHPETPLDYRKFCQLAGVDPDLRPRDSRWRNKLCDTQVAWSHAHHRRDVLVTSDQNFLKHSKSERLRELGVPKICRPSEAVLLL